MARWAGLRGTTLGHDLSASLVVFLVAVPLSLGIALASGAPIVAGLIAAVIGGIVVGALGGAPLQVSGPAAGLTLVLAETITRYGWAATCGITVAAGLLQILFGLSGIARAALAITPAIVHGMLAGIGVTIVLGQLHVVLGGEANSSAVENLLGLPEQIAAHHDAAAMLGLLTIGILLGWGRLPATLRRVPGPLAAIASVTVLATVTGLSVDRVTLPEDILDIGLVARLPDGGWFDLGLAVLTVALIASVETLLSAVAVDRLHDGPRANLNRELVGQGVANMTSGSLGGLPVTGVIVRSSANVAAGARTRASAILHGVWVLLFTVALAGLIGAIPLAALAGLLVYIGAKLVNLKEVKEIRKHGNLWLLLVTLVGVVAVDLLTGVLAGIACSLALTLRRTMWSGIHAEGDGDRRRVVIEGALTFLSVPRLSAVLTSLPPGSTVTVALVVDYLDHAAFDCLSNWQHAHERGGGRVRVDEIGHPWFAKGKTDTPTIRRHHARPALPRWLAPWSDWMAQDSTLDSTLGSGVEVPDQRTELSAPHPDARPRTLLLTCSDARALPDPLTGGDLFTVRNVGNLVPTDHDTSVGASIDYAVTGLGVREIVVCGHSACGAMAALREQTPADTPVEMPDEMPLLAHWLRHGEPSTLRQRDRPPVTLDGTEPDTPQDRLALHNVLQQLDNLRRHPQVAQAEKRGALRLTGMYVDVAAARVYLFDAATGTFAHTQLSDLIA
ncbi:carbonic anhydrase [Actinophytocola xinjiangensis]|uniref:Carbonic anhydrase n=1 Tax=Actinophytocola xinjiangensis TaxID=485602 RepID=A0A7Z1AWP9_9PSEU|nr:bifunctional SulP family inorganic anion transporter/carbonic anhydrase [Actinophytocola xinjiangensis]OLF06785.1 carbonic anhydrase [Actinophytocola xinjiangensis]